MVSGTLFGGGVTGEGTKRWGIEGIRRGTSDLFGRDRGEFIGFLVARNRACVEKKTHSFLFCGALPEKN